MKSSDGLSAKTILGVGGSIARRLDGYEPRPQQIEMANAIADALSNRQHLVAEAGTGTGKSFAYLVPAILHATADEATLEASVDADQPAPTTSDKASDEPPRRRRVLISTHTIALQEQLVNKDLPLLSAVIPREFSSVLVKGRRNYLSIRRMERAIAKSASTFAFDNQHVQLQAIRKWAGETTDGSLASLPIKPDREVWDEVASDTSNCLRRACPHHEKCFYFRARRRAQGAQLMIVNHALLFSDLALRQQGVSILPDYDVVVLDECHTVESVAGDHLGIRLTNGQFNFVLDRLYNDRNQKGLLVAEDLRELQKRVDRCRFAMTDLFADLLDWLESGVAKNGRVPRADVVVNPLSNELEQLGDGLKRHAKMIRGESERKDFDSAAERCIGLAGSLRAWLSQDIDGCVYWIERSGSRRGMDRVTLLAAPTHVGESLRNVLFGSDQIDSVILTSATLATGNDDRFKFFRERIGLTGGGNVRVGSPFDYGKQAKLVLVNDLPDPSADRVAFERAIPNQVKRFVGHSGGGAFVLFTSYDLLRRTAEAITGWAIDEGITIFSQAEQKDRTQMLDQFRDTPRSVLLGTDSFWQGVDVPGDALTNVIITKLPFAVPGHPLLEARLESIRDSGGNPFGDYQLPEAIIKFRQGFGRLIRTRQDSGMVVVLDPRIETKRYGRQFVEALPKMKIHVVSKNRRPR